MTLGDGFGNRPYASVTWLADVRTQSMISRVAAGRVDFVTAMRNVAPGMSTSA